MLLVLGYCCVILGNVMYNDPDRVLTCSVLAVDIKDQEAVSHVTYNNINT